MNQKAGSSKNGKLPLVPPLLRDVGKLAAGVASVSTGSATGNLRNKHALQPGHSLMDWIRLGASGKDLTGVGSRAGSLSVTLSELALHNTAADAWLCIRGRVYNVSAYLPFHPGGPDELMRAVGKDATSLFEDVHPWVNFEQILNKCYIGPLRPPSIENVFGPPSTDSKLKLVQSQEDITNNKIEENKTTPETTTTIIKDSQNNLPRFDWIQKLDFITIIFYTGTFSNPLIETNQINPELITITLFYNSNNYENEIQFHKAVNWPCQIKVVGETGKIEIIFKKVQSQIWENYGVLKQTVRQQPSITQARFQCTIANKTQVNHNTYLLKLDKKDTNKIVVPIGKHVKVFDTINDTEISRSYTPVPHCLFDGFGHRPFATSTICLLVKRYPDGNISRSLCDRQIGDSVTISRPLGTFNLSDLERRETFILLAAGTGITPMFSTILFLLERRIRKCQRLRLVFFNRTRSDILFRSEFDRLAVDDGRFTVIHVLSQPEDSWVGPQGHINKKLVEDTIKEHLHGTTYFKQDVFWMVCGPNVFTNLARDILKELNVDEGQMHLFMG